MTDQKESDLPEVVVSTSLTVLTSLYTVCSVAI